MTKEEFGTIAKVLKAVYTDPKFLPDKDAFDVWYSLLRDCDYQTMKLVTEKYIATNKFPPTIADLREPLMDEADDPLAAWGLVVKAVQNSNYNAEVSFGRLPEKIQKAVGTPLNLEAWANIPSETLHTVTQSQFISAYKGVCARERAIEKTTPVVREAIAQPKPELALPMDDDPEFELPFVDADAQSNPFDNGRIVFVENWMDKHGYKRLRDFIEP